MLSIYIIYKYTQRCDIEMQKYRFNIHLTSLYVAKKKIKLILYN